MTSPFQATSNDRRRGSSAARVAARASGAESGTVRTRGRRTPWAAADEFSASGLLSVVDRHAAPNAATAIATTATNPTIARPFRLASEVPRLRIEDIAES